jgi:hypothetical protein
LVKMRMVICLQILTIIWMAGRIPFASCWMYMGLTMLGGLKYIQLRH